VPLQGTMCFLRLSAGSERVALSTDGYSHYAPPGRKIRHLNVAGLCPEAPAAGGTGRSPASERSDKTGREANRTKTARAPRRIRFTTTTPRAGEGRGVFVGVRNFFLIRC
ncbi:MAG: hypothetical protein LBD14_04125, partial [Puniceicoccales bacterium]|jgi:hypothetical protein|nr:hypothetical protein [Puniceicoccales bacterium]